MGQLKMLKILIFSLTIFFGSANAQVMKRSNCAVPLDETKSAPAIDLLDQHQNPIDRDRIIDFIRSGIDSSIFEPQLSDLYVNKPLSLKPKDENFPSDPSVIESPFEFVSAISVDHLTQAKIRETGGTRREYRLTVTYDLNAALARNALLRKLGYDIPAPRYYSKISIRFQDQKTRDDFLIQIARMRDPSRWLAGGKTEYDQNKLTITLINVALEPSLIRSIPPLHWGIFKSEVIQSRRTIRSMLIPLTLLDIDESANMYSFEPAKIENDNLLFSRVYATSFKNETSIGDARWIARKINKLTRIDWQEIISSGHYPSDVAALILEKTISRTHQMMKLLSVPGLEPLRCDLEYRTNISIGNVSNGKLKEIDYPGYPHYFAYGDPLNPLRLSEIARYFTVEAFTNGIQFALDQMNKKLQLRTQDFYIQKHVEELQKNQIYPFIQPVEAFGGPIAGGSVSASRNVMTGTYYGSESPIQLVDTLSAQARVGAFIGISGLKKLGVGFTPTLSYNRNYVHVRPIQDMKTALKDNWLNVAVPFNMAKLSKTLIRGEGEDSSAAIERFLGELKTGEMIIIVDGFSLGNQTMVGIPIGALLGLMPLASSLSETLTINNQYAILSRTTLYKSDKGLHVYLTDTHSNTHEISADTQFILRLFNLSTLKNGGKAETEAFILPEALETESQRTSFENGIQSILRKNNASIIQKEFKPYQLNHQSNGGRILLKFGPWQWTKREIINRHTITPPLPKNNEYNPDHHRRTVIQGQTNVVKGSDPYGFLGSSINRFFSFFNFGKSARGDDPATNFLGKSKTLIISTEIETTPNRENNTMVRIQETHTGWTIRKKKLLKLIDEISSDIKDFTPDSGLVDLDSFTQTKSVQAYNLVWNLSIYEPGIQKLFHLLDSNQSDTRTATESMINIIGKEKYLSFCKAKGVQPGFSSESFDWDRLELHGFETIDGKMTFVNCITPWMRSVFDLRNRLHKHPEIFDESTHDDRKAKEKISLINSTFASLEKNSDLSTLVRMLGVENIYFQLSVAGYRKGDERAQDEEGRSTYYSNTIGSINKKSRTGPLDEIANSSSILQHEISARYLSNGF